MRTRIVMVVRASALGLLSQIFSFGAGILVVRELTKSGYAQYAASAAVVAALAVVADSGIGSTLIARAATTFSDKSRLGEVLGSALAVRRQMLAVVAIPGLGVLVYLLIGTGAAWWVVVTSSVLTVFTVFVNLNRAVTSVELQLSARFATLQAVDLSNSSFRFLVTACLAIFQAASQIAFLAVAAVGSALQSWLSMRDMRRRVTIGAASPDEVALFRRAVAVTAPASVLMVFGEQLVSVVFVIFGNPSAIADVAALTRFSLAFVVVNTVLGNFAASWLAKLTPDRGSLLRAAVRFLGVYATIASVYVGGVALVSTPLLGLLGKSYQGLELELIVLAAGTAVSNFASYGVGLVNHSRGWVRWSWLYAPTLVVWLVFGLLVIRPSDTFSASVFAASLPCVLLVTQTARFLFGLRGSRPSGVFN